MHLLTPEFLEHLGFRLTGPGALRFVIQPTVAILLGLRDGLHDARAGTPPFVYDLLFRPAHRAATWRRGLAGIGKPVLVASVLDAILQYLILQQVNVIGALITGTLLMGLPYALARGLANRLATLAKHT